MKVAIIGAGIAGLVAARRITEYNLDCTIYEMSGCIGGTWAYTENAFTDEFDNPIHTSMFAAVRIITPTQLMEVDGLEFKPKSGSSYPGHKEVLEYYEEFTNKYRLRQFIKFYHLVMKILRSSDNWILTVKNLKQNKIETHIFDAVMVCIGRYSKGQIPKISGMETFIGDQIHSHNYRQNTPYKEKTLLVIGTGNSAMEIALDCSKVAKKIYLSYRSKPPETKLNQHIEIKPQVILIDGNQIHFKDGTMTEVDCIIFCTGYTFDNSILDQSCGIEFSNDEIVKPLYKMFINITHPTMCFIGLPQKTIVPVMDDLQAQIFVKHLTGIINLPPKDEMTQSFYNEYEKKTRAGLFAGEFYNLYSTEKEYFDELSQLGDIKLVPRVLFHLRKYSVEFRKKNYLTFRNQHITVIDDESFTCTWPNNAINETKM